MRYRRLGRTNFQVSQLSLGGAAFGQQYGPVTAHEVETCVRMAVDAGVNFIDTSAYYGQGVSETLLGSALSGGLRNRILLGTKAGRLDRAQFDFSRDGMRRCVEASLKRLQTDHVDILLAHDIEFSSDFNQIFDETTQTLQDLKTEGKCRMIGMSCYPLGLLRQVIERCQLDVVISYCHYNLQNTRLISELLPVAKQYDVGVLNASPLAMGLLTHEGPPPWHPAPEPIKSACRIAAEFCQSQGADISQLGMQYCYAEEQIPSTITGTAKQDEFQKNLSALSGSPNPKLLRAVETLLTPIHNQTWSSGNWIDTQ